MLPQPFHTTVRRIYEMHELKRGAESARGYLGASEIGESCARRLWYGFRWCAPPAAEGFDGRMLRLFEAGNIFEARVIAELRSIGVKVEGEQHAVDFVNGHGKGHMDGAVLGLEEAPRTWHLLEAKTHNAKSFADLKKNGVQKSKPKHYAQMQMYMGLAGLTRAAYVAENKDTSELLLERVEFDQAEFDRLLRLAKQVVYSAEPPPRIADDPLHFECRFCPYGSICHGEAVPAATCRSCAHSTPLAERGAWRCERFGAEIPPKAQREGCDEHRFIPRLLERIAELVDADATGRVRWRNKLTAKTFDQPGYTSAEMAAAKDFRIVGDDFVTEIKAVFGFDSRVVRSTPQERGDAPASDLAIFYDEVVTEAWEAGRE